MVEMSGMRQVSKKSEYIYCLRACVGCFAEIRGGERPIRERPIRDRPLRHAFNLRVAKLEFAASIQVCRECMQRSMKTHSVGIAQCCLYTNYP